MDVVLCRICGGRIDRVFSLGLLHPSAFLRPGEDPPVRSPLALGRCSTCGLVQLTHSVAPDQLYRTYYYQSGINPAMVTALKDVVTQAQHFCPLAPGDVVVDIASNDGTLLSFYPPYVTTVGFDPAQNLPQVGRVDHFINDYFSSDAWPTPVPQARIVTSIAMFYDLPNPGDFVRGVTRILAPGGVWVLQLSDLTSMLKTNAVDNICHEHLEYYSIRDIDRLMTAAGLKIFHIEHNEVNGGSLRFYISQVWARIPDRTVDDFAQADLAYLESEAGSLPAFGRRVLDAQQDLTTWLHRTHDQGKWVYGLAASTKGNTLLQTFGLGPGDIQAIADLNPEKFGRTMVGSGIPIISQEKALEDAPDAFILLAWHFLPGFLKTFRDWILDGGTLVVPLPVPWIYQAGLYPDGSLGVVGMGLKELLHGN